MNTGHSAEQIERIGADPLVLLREEPAFAPERTSRTTLRPRTCCPRSSPASPASPHRVPAPALLDPLGIGERWMSPYGGIEHGASAST
jgi:hypothetical protein